ncbi:hypothetical protein ACOSQ4_016374 [Xanthoceras sorbifolium]
MAHICDSPSTKDLGKNLGVPLIHSRINNRTYIEIVDKTLKRLTSWKSATLSFAGRITLIKAVTSALLVYAMQSVKLPGGICSNMDRINRNFLWGHMEEKKAVHLIKWDTVCKPKSKGGLGLKKMKNLNQSLLAKAGWRMIQPGAGLWSSLLHNKYFENGVLLDKIGKSKGTCSSTWRGITFEAANLAKGLLWRLGDWKSINFWTERWLPDLGSLEAHACIQLNEDKLKEKVCCYFDKGSWDIHKLRDVVPEALVHRIICVYANGNVNKHDKLIWGLSNGGNFTVKSAYDLQCGVAEVTEWDWNFIWRLKLPPKITHFLWLLLHGRLLTNVHRCSRGLDDVATCPRCNISNEDLNHLLRDCNYSINIWRSIWGCGRASTLLKGDLNTWLRCNLKDKSCSDNMIPNFLLFASTLWFLWKWRCSSIFDDKFSLPFWPNIVIKRYCKEWLQANESGKRDCSENSHLIVWLPPCQRWIKLNVDGGRSSYGGKIYA